MRECVVSSACRYYGMTLHTFLTLVVGGGHVSSLCLVVGFFLSFVYLQLIYEFERSVLSKDQLAQKTGKDMGDDVMGASGGERFVKYRKRWGESCRFML